MLGHNMEVALTINKEKMHVVTFLLFESRSSEYESFWKSNTDTITYI